MSVCLLTYNHAHTVEEALRSLLNQSIDGYEVVVSDDGSTDGTWERILDVAGKDSRVKPVRTPRNLGMAGNANFASTLARRQYLAILHHDDLYSEHLLEKWGGVLDRHPDVGFVFNAYAVHGCSKIYGHALSGEHVCGREFLEKLLFPNWGCPVRGTAMIRRSAWEAIGGMDERFGLLADVDLWMRLSMHWAAGYVGEPLITIRQARPSNYPDEYSQWSWRRQVILYEIHARNRERYYQSSWKRNWEWFRFRTRLSTETAKWLTYALLRRKRSMIETMAESETPYDYWWVGFLRWGLGVLESRLPQTR